MLAGDSRQIQDPFLTAVKEDCIVVRKGHPLPFQRQTSESIFRLVATIQDMSVSVRARDLVNEYIFMTRWGYFSSCGAALW